jgi:hypothetical protein
VVSDGGAGLTIHEPISMVPTMSSMRPMAGVRVKGGARAGGVRAWRTARSVGHCDGDGAACVRYVPPERNAAGCGAKYAKS